MDEKLDKLRRERAAQYMRLSEAEKPRVMPCEQCKELPYKNAICPETGIFHNLERHTIVGGSIVQSNILRSSELMEAIDRSRVRWVESRTQLVRADATSLNVFQSFVQQLDWSLQRYGILYGKYDEALATVEVHAVYEPEQHGDAHTFHYLPDERLWRVDRVASLLGLRRVGVVCTHPPRDINEIVLSGREMLLCTREQSRSGDACVLLTISPSITSGRVECQAWQTSPQAVHFYRLGVLQEKSGDLADLETAKLVHSTIPLEVAQQDRDEKGHQQVVTKSPSHDIDTRWFTSYVAVQRFDSPVVRNLFMRVSRPGMEPPTLENLRNYMEDSKRSSATMLEKLTDFHVLVFLACNVFSVEDDMPVIIGAIMGRLPVEDAMQYEFLLKSYFEE